MRNIILFLVLLSTACGGAEFGSVDTEAVGGELAAAGDGGGAMPSAGSGGSASGAPAGGMGGQPLVTAGGPSAAGSSGAPVACEFDPELLTAALPTTLTWDDFMYTSGELCVQCRDKPCRTVPVISWGVPVYDETAGGYVYLPNTEKPMISLLIGTNDGSCTAVKECGTKLTSVSVVVQVKDGYITSAKVGTMFQDNMCTSQAGAGTYTWSTDMNSEISDSLKGLKFGCAK